MSANPFTPPRADIDALHGDDDPSRAGPADTPFFSVSVLKLVVMSACTLGFYQWYWFYRNWVHIRGWEQSGLSPAVRTFFGIFWCYPCLRRIRRHEMAAGVAKPLAAGLQSVAWTLLTLCTVAPPPLLLIGFFSVAALATAQSHVNGLHRLEVPDHEPNARFTVWNWIAIVVGAPTMLLGAVGVALGLG